MIIRPELQALRSDDAPQRQVQDHLAEVLARWRSSPVMLTAQRELARFSAGSALEDLPLFSSLFESGSHIAPQLVGEVVSLFLGELSRNPLGQIPLRGSTTEVVTSVQLLRRGTTVLTLQAIDGSRLANQPDPVSANYSASETWEYVLSGTAVTDRIVLHGEGKLESQPMDLMPGKVFHRLGAREALHYRQVPGWLVTLKLQRRDSGAQVAREYMLKTGELIHQSAASPRDSRLELTASLLARMGRRDAAPLLGAMAEEQGSAPMRWQVLRECLALDSATGFAALCRIAADPADCLAAHAGALRAQLLETYPALAAIEALQGAQPCPA